MSLSLTSTHKRRVRSSCPSSLSENLRQLAVSFSRPLYSAQDDNQRAAAQHCRNALHHFGAGVMFERDAVRGSRVVKADQPSMVIVSSPIVLGRYGLDSENRWVIEREPLRRFRNEPMSRASDDHVSTLVLATDTPTVDSVQDLGPKASTVIRHDA